MTVYEKRGAAMEPILAKFFANFFPKFYEYVSSHDDAARIGLKDLSAEERRVWRLCWTISSVPATARMILSGYGDARRRTRTSSSRMAIRSVSP
jgi:hypothetical protein